MWWVMIWVLLLIGSGAYLGVRSWGLWGQARELGSELAIAQRRLDEVQGQLELLEEAIGSPDDLAVFAAPATARKERDRVKVASRRARRRRRAISRPAWARHVD